MHVFTNNSKVIAKKNSTIAEVVVVEGNKPLNVQFEGANFLVLPVTEIPFEDHHNESVHCNERIFEEIDLSNIPILIVEDNDKVDNTRLSILP